MLRIKYKKGTLPFEFRGIKKTDCPAVIKQHLALWGKETVAEGGRETHRRIPPGEFEAFWQEGDGEWDDAAPTEALPTT